MSLRVTNNAQIERSIYDINASGARLQRTQQDISTGMRLHRPSDDPTANARAMVLKTSMAQNEQYTKNIQATANFVQVTDTATTGYINALQRLRNLAVQGASGNLRSEDKGAIAQEVMQIREEIRTIGNSQYNGRYIFGGFKTDTPPYPADLSFATDDQGKLNTEIAPGITVNYNVNGTSLFGPVAQGVAGSIFGTIDTFNGFLGDATSTDDISKNTIAELDGWLKKAGQSRTDLGGLTNRLDLASQRFSEVNTDLETLLNQTEATDIASA
ncbi:MAG: flagellar hook-associated protein 3 [Cyanobacteria bacterium RYN_339]|nr:flagellar hook-associated protein 3 [Cyanobacteria bacterium RYN_339]